MPVTTVLIVDDGVASREAIELALLGIDGLSLLHASDGRQAWECITSAAGGRIGAVITDLRMPVLDGFELIVRIRGDAMASRLPVIVVSGETDANACERALALGADAYFPKPWSPLQLRVKLEQLLYERNATPCPE